MNREDCLSVLFQKLTLKDDFCPDASFYEDHFKSTLGAVLHGGWHGLSLLKKSVISQKTFPFLWNNDVSKRSMLVNELCSRDNGLSRQYRSGLAIIVSAELERIFNVEVESNFYPNFKRDCVEYRIKLANLLPGDFDYLHEIKKLDPTKDEQYINLWMRAGRRSSKDPNFYDYWWSSIKRRPGASNEKLEVISRMDSANIYSDAILSEVSKRGTKKVKRALVSRLARDINSQVWDIKSAERSLKEDPDQKELLLKLNKWKENFDNLESALMLFADCDDREILSDMIDAVSHENLTWLIPAASKHYYLSRRIESKIAQESK